MAVGGFLMAMVGTAFAVLFAVLFNLISDLTGGIRVSVIELENLRDPSAAPDPAPRGLRGRLGVGRRAGGDTDD